MSLVINAPLVEGKLQQEAAKRGVSAEQYAMSILERGLEQRADSGAAAAFYATATPEQWDAAFDAWVDSHPARPALPDAALARESFYGGDA